MEKAAPVELDVQQIKTNSKTTWVSETTEKYAILLLFEIIDESVFQLDGRFKLYSWTCFSCVQFKGYN
jgi:hypothetical protein